MKIKLIYPIIAGPVTGAMLPYGMGVLASFLKKNGHEVNIEDNSIRTDINYGIFKNIEKLHLYLKNKTTNKKIDKFLRKIIDIQKVNGYGLIGFSIMSYYQLYPALLVAKYIKKNHKNISVVFGGAYPTLYWKLFFYEYDFINYVIAGFGEEPIKYLAEHIDNKRGLEEIPGLIYRSKGQVCSNERKIYSLEEEAVPDFAGFDFSKYKVHIRKDRPVIVPYRISNGCVNNCSFCTFIARQEFQYKSVDKVVGELKELKDRYNSRCFYFCDSAINFSSKYLKELCELFIKTNLDISWGTHIAAHDLTKDMFNLMNKAGCSFLQFGIESGSNKILSSMAKRHTAESAAEILKNSHEAGINNYISLIAGYPHETKDDINNTIAFVENNARYIYRTAVLEFILKVNSRMYKSPEKYGINNIRQPHEFYLLDNYTFDEIGGLAWKDKLKQRKQAFNLINKVCYKNVTSKKYTHRFIPYSVYVILDKVLLNIDYFYKWKSLIINFFVKRAFSSFYNK